MVSGTSEKELTKNNTKFTSKEGKWRLAADERYFSLNCTSCRDVNDGWA